MTIIIALAMFIIGGVTGLITGIIIATPRNHGDRGSREAQDIER